MLDLKYFLDLLEQRQTVIFDKIKTKNETIRELGSSSLNDECDNIVANLQGETNAEIVRVYHVELKEIEVALAKMKAKTYGICEECDDEISVERLTAKPHARFCLECREIFEKNNILELKKSQFRA